MSKLSLAIVGDFNPSNESHLATNHALEHASQELGTAVDYHWIGTEELAAPGSTTRLAAFGGIWIAPASPYRSLEGALAAIRLARESALPLLGTCGGFQHIILEHARNVLGFTDAEHQESNPRAPRLFISRLSCSLAGRTLEISLAPGSRLARLYARTKVRESYYCNFGVNPEYVETLRASALRIVASDAEGVVRAVELAEHPFFVGTLFLPQLNSTATRPHPVVTGFLKALAVSASSTNVAGRCN